MAIQMVKFQWTLAGKIPKFEEDFGECKRE